jgi:hypothetical protein
LRGGPAGCQRPFDEVDLSSPFKNRAGKAQEKAKPVAYFSYVRVWLFRSNAARADFWADC